MKKILIIIAILFNYYSVLACDCEQPKTILEFYDSEYVFEGKVINKTYSDDSLMYNITVKVLKHYKENSHYPNIFNFEFKSEFNSTVTSCDSHISNNDELLIYAKKLNNKLYFNLKCSNSKKLNSKELTTSELNILENGNDFKLSNYIYQNESYFNYVRPITDIDLILNKSVDKSYKNSFIILKLLINDKGNLERIAKADNLHLIEDSIYKIPKTYKIDASIINTEFEKDAISFAEQINEWEIKRHYKTNIAVSYIKNIILTFNNDSKKWEYEL